MPFAVLQGFLSSTADDIRYTAVQLGVKIDPAFTVTKIISVHESYKAASTAAAEADYLCDPAFGNN
jgi:hypothetical protein